MMDFRCYLKPIISVLSPQKYSAVASIALFHVVNGEKPIVSIVLYNVVLSYIDAQIQEYSTYYRAITLTALSIGFGLSENSSIKHASNLKCRLVVLWALFCSELGGDCSSMESLALHVWPDHARQE
jgi:hypothetical protein